jgi:hypothetical protein
MSSKKTSRFDGLFGAARSAKSEPSAQSEEPKHLDIQTSKSKDPNYQRTTLYLPKPLHRKFKFAAIEDEREMSEIMEELITQWLESRENS